MALWWPQMGGYHGRALAVSPPEENSCLEVYVWHDGEFPFSDDERSPVGLHICDPEQWIQLGTQLAEFREALGGTGEARVSMARLTVFDAVSERRAAEDKIFTILRELEYDTGLRVVSVKLTHDETYSGPSRGAGPDVVGVRLEVQL